MRGWVAVFVVTLLAGAARADDVPVRRLKIAERHGNLVVSGGFTDVFDATTADQLDSGFETTVVLRAYVYKKGEELPVAVTAATYRVVYDLWDEVYDVQIHDPLGEREFKEASRAQVLKDVTTLSRFPVAPLDDVTIGQTHFVALIVEVNPVSQELLAEVRRWIARPGAEEVAGGSSFFGSFVSIFVNPKIEEADRVLRFRSQDFYRVSR